MSTTEWWLNRGHNGDSEVQNLTKVHNFSIGIDQDRPVRQDGVLQGLLHLLAGWESDQELKRLKWLARGALVVKSDILEI